MPANNQKNLDSLQVASKHGNLEDTALIHGNFRIYIALQNPQRWEIFSLENHEISKGKN